MGSSSDLLPMPRTCSRSWSRRTALLTSYPPMEPPSPPLRSGSTAVRGSASVPLQRQGGGDRPLQPWALPNEAAIPVSVTGMRLRGAVLSVVIVLTGIAVLLAIAALAGALGRPLRWELPPGYRGWVVVRFGDPACPPLRGSGIYLVVPVTAGGRGCTSSPVPAGWRYYRYEYVGPDGIRTVIRSSG
jgi:hypothetical protein